MFHELAKSQGEDVRALRWRCLRHQIQIIDDQIKDRASDSAELEELRGVVVRALAATHR
jgi:hypothetical protein